MSKVDGVKIGKYYVPYTVLDPYVAHVVGRFTGQIRGDIERLEFQRLELHTMILQTIGLDRDDTHYDHFAKKLEEYCEAMIPAGVL